MKNNGIIVAVILFVVLIIGMFVFAFLKKSEMNETNTPTTETPIAGPYDSITRIDAKHFFIDGVHTLVGTITMPTACDLLNWDVATSITPDTASINFDVINTAETCAQALTDQRFKVEFAGSEAVDIRATLEGRAIALNLIPPGEGETPDDFELFLKE